MTLKEIMEAEQPSTAICSAAPLRDKIIFAMELSRRGIVIGAAKEELRQSDYSTGQMNAFQAVLNWLNEMPPND